MDISSLKCSQLGNLVLSSGVLHSSWSKILDLHRLTNPNRDSTLQFNTYEEAKYILVVFAAPQLPRNDSLDSASTLLHGSQNNNPFQFLCSEKITSFSVQTRAFQLFSSANRDLSNLKSKLLRLQFLRYRKPVIITGAELGGAVASLFTLWLLETINPRERPLCITFGSPLIVDVSLQEILENSVMNSCFLHVADAARTSFTTGFKPFGTFLICFDSECICIEDPEAVMELLMGDAEDLVDYGEVLTRIDRSVLSKVGSGLMIDDVINRMEERVAMKKLLSNPFKRLNDMKTSLMYFDWYNKRSRKDKIGYYDWFKTQTTSSCSEIDNVIITRKKELNDYWKSVVGELEKKSQSDISLLRRQIIFSANIYRRLIEPLDIAIYYLSGGKDYQTLGRSLHYVMLEKWFGKRFIEQYRSARSDLLTFDSCFWAEVEEALIVTNMLKTHVEMRDNERKVLMEKLVRFEVDVWEMIDRCEVSPDIFLEKSSFMRWWKNYKEIKGSDGSNSSPSHLTEFMNTGKYEIYARQIAGEHLYDKHTSRILIILNVNSNVTEVKALFEPYGDIRSIYTANREPVIVSYFDIRASQAALRALQNKLLGQRRLDIHFSFSMGNKGLVNQESLVVSNLAPSVSNEELKDIFGTYGEVKEILETSNMRHHKFVEFFDVRAADAAFKALNGSNIAGRRIKLERNYLRQNNKLQWGPDFERSNSPMDKMMASMNYPSPVTMASTSAHQLDTNVKLVDNRKQFQLDLSKIMSEEDTRTTLMIKNIPKQYTLKMLLDVIDEKNRGTYDFLYLPTDFKSKCNVGYAFINMVSPKFIIPFYEAFSGKPEIVTYLEYAQIQGKDALVAHFQNSSLMKEDRQYGPIVFDGNSSYTIISEAAEEITGETECILVFSCSDNLDVDETSFIEAISKELHKREVTSLTYNLLGRENLDEEMLYRSSVGIMILSNSYAFSSQSLDHLVEIMEHGKATNLVIFPIYFKVSASDICGLEGRFEAVFLQYLNSSEPGRVQKWKAAMSKIASIDGDEWTKETQVMLAEEVVINACLRLYVKNSKNLFRIFALLNQPQHSGADIVGIWGMAGIGKTSIAREIFGVLAPQYDLCYFLQDFHQMSQSKGPRQLRDDFYSKLFGEEKPSISASDIKPSFMRDWFHRKKILVVLDDVSNARDVEAVVGGFGWLSDGHRIILTSRKKQVLVQCKVKDPYEIQKLCEFESFRICKQYLNEESSVIPELMRCSSGIPLALKFLCSSVWKKHINNMTFYLQFLRRNPPTQIQETFRRSFDRLDENEKNIYLDLACFFRGENKDHVVQLLDACGFLTYLGICDLVDESLISILDNRIEIPIPFQDMGRYIVHEEDEDPCERSRLWDSNDITNVLTNNTGTDAIEGILLDATDLTCELSPTVFDKMYRLRLLKFHSSTSGKECKLSLPQGLDSLPDELRLLHWENYPLESLPQKFNPESLVELNMPYSNMEKLWEGKKNLSRLKTIKLSHSRNLTDIMMLSEALNLEHIDLEGCTSLVDVSTSIPRNGKLVSLNMKDCSHLRNLPALVDLTSLKLLNMSGCSELEEIQDIAPNLKEIYLAGTAITQLPLSFEDLTELVTLDLENCKSLHQLPFGISNSRSIVKLKLSGCTSLELRKRKRSDLTGQDG